MTHISKRGQGLAFVSILVLVAILYFVFRFNTDTYGFIMQAGDEQAHLITAYAEGAKAKAYAGLAARQAALEAIWNISNGSTDAAALGNCTDAKFEPLFSAFFDRYISMYSPSTYLVDTSIPDYKFAQPSCKANSYLTIEGYGYSEECILKDFPFPEIPCEDITVKANCNKTIKFTNGSEGACYWNQTLNSCTDSLPEPNCAGQDNSVDCESLAAADGKYYCSWQTSYSEAINVLSPPLINYQFSIDSDAHFIENISGAEYEAFAQYRESMK